MPVDVACVRCGTVVSVKPFYARKLKYCSRVCKAVVESITLSGTRSVHYRDSQARFWEKVRKTDGCWEWIGVRKRFEYGSFNVQKKNVKAHRFAYETLVGPIPPGLNVCHHCDNPSCVNPAHLFLGTDKDNRDDCVRKGRHNSPTGQRNWLARHPETMRGARNSNAKLTTEQVAEIRAAMETQPTLATRYGVSLVTINRIRCGRAWSCQSMT